MIDLPTRPSPLYSTFLVPLDGSHLAESVLPLVQTLATGMGARVVLLHVLERGAPAAVHGERHLTAADEADGYLAGVGERLGAGGLTVERHTHTAREGDVARSIADHAEETGADLIILCTHGSGRVRERLFGTIAQKVLNHGQTPVLLVRPAGGEPVKYRPQRILTPLDGTAAAEAALDPAEELARRLGANLHLVMVVGTPETMRGGRPAATLLPSAARALLEMEEDEAAGYLETLAEGLRAHGVSVTTEVRRGSTAAELADEAAEPGVGLVVVATHGRAGVQAIWAGSVTARLLARTQAPVLLLRMVEP